MNRVTDRFRFSRAGRLALAALAAAVVVAGAIVTSGAGGKGEEYLVRANFMTSSGVTTGADVRVGGATVGSIAKIYVNDANMAAIVLKITDPAFQRFYSDATCRVRLQSLIGEKFVDCDPGTPTKPELEQDPADPERRLLRVKHTRSPVDFDELLDSMREPERERFRVVMSELGITLTGRGQDLQDIIIRFDGTFKELNDVMKILAEQNQDLETMAVDGDAALREFAASRKHVTGFFREADQTSRAVNEKRAELEESLARIPDFLDELEPTARELRRISEEAAPVARSARQSAENLSTFVTNTNEFVAAANPALKRFGSSMDVFRSKLPVLEPIASDLRTFVGYRSAVTNVRKLLESFDEQGGYKNMSSMAYGIATAMNGYDSFGHFMRSGLVLNGACFYYSQGRSKLCAADFSDDRSADNMPPESGSGTSSAASAPRMTSSGEAAALDYLLGGEKR